MNAPFDVAAKACLLSAVTGFLISNGDCAAAESKGAVRHADVVDDTLVEPAPLSEEAVKAVPKEKSKGTQRKRTSRTKPVDYRSAGSKLGARSESSSDEIEQTASYPARPVSQQAPVYQQTPTAQPAAAPAGGNSEVQQRLQELYRKNGRTMPNMNMEEFQAQPQTSPNVPATRNGPTSIASPEPSRPAIRQAKPNFLERVFKFGKGRRQPQQMEQPAPRTQPQQGAQNHQPPVQTWPAPASRTQNPQGMPYGPFRGGQQPQPQMPQTQPPQAQGIQTPLAVPQPAVNPAPASPPVQRRIGLPPSDDAELSGPTISVPEKSADPSYRGPTIRSRDPQPFADEKGMDDESMDLEADELDGEPAPTQSTPSLPTNPTEEPAEKPTDSPYSGRRIAPTLIEQNIATGSDDELEEPEESLDMEELSPSPDARPEVKLNERPQPAAVEPKPANAAPSATMTLPELPEEKPAASNASNAADELLKLDDLDDDADEDDMKLDELDERRAPAKDELEIPVDEPPAKKPAAEPAPKTEATPRTEAAPRTETPARQEPRPSDKSTLPHPLKGFKGYCPVKLKDDRQLVESKPQFKAEYRGRSYNFASAAAKEAFEENPRKYIPAGGGADVVRLAAGEEGIEGTLEHAAWYRGRLYLFATPETRKAFIETPSRFIIND